jgi:hypothetical protein
MIDHEGYSNGTCPLNVPVSIKIGGGELVCVVYSVSFNRIDYLCLAERGISHIAWNTEKPIGYCYDKKFWKNIPIEDLPLYVGYQNVWPLLGEIIKTGSLDCVRKLICQE